MVTKVKAPLVEVEIDGTTTNLSAYLNVDDVETYAAMQAIDVTTISDYRTINVAERTVGGGGGGSFYWLSGNKTSDVTGDPSFGKYVPPTSDLTGASGVWIRKGFDVNSIALQYFGGIEGSDTSNAATNASAVEAAVEYAASKKGGTVCLGTGEWVFGAVTLEDLNYWRIRGGQNKIRTTGAFTIKGCGFWELGGFEAQPTVSGAHDGFVLEESATNRNARFRLHDANIGNYDNGIRSIDDISQGFIQRIQLGANNKSILMQGGATTDHVIFDELIFGNHVAGAVCMDLRINNFTVTNCHFETNHDDFDTHDILVGDGVSFPQNFRIQNNTFTQSGGIIVNANSGLIQNNYMTRTVSEYGIHVIAGEVAVNGNSIRWDANTSAGRYDGTNKTGVRLDAAVSCDCNYVKRSDKAYVVNAANIDMVGNNVNDAITSGIEIGSNENVKISGGAIFVGKSTAVGIRQLSGNGSNIEIGKIAWTVTGSAARVAFAGGRPRIELTGNGSPEGVEYGGQGSTFANYGGGSGSSLYAKTTAATLNTGWVNIA